MNVFELSSDIVVMTIIFFKLQPVKKVLVITKILLFNSNTFIDSTKDRFGDLFSSIVNWTSGESLDTLKDITDLRGGQPSSSLAKLSALYIQTLRCAFRCCKVAYEHVVSTTWFYSRYSYFNGPPFFSVAFIHSFRKFEHLV